MLKVYGTLWAALAFLALLLFVTGNFTILTLVVFGFIVFGMIFMGMIAVLPTTVVHHAPPKLSKAKIKPVSAPTGQSAGIFETKKLATR